jgi:hypothetical protein
MHKAYRLAAGGAAREKMHQVMHEYKHGELHSGTGVKGKKRPNPVSNRAQAIAIGLSESGQSKK